MDSPQDTSQDTIQQVLDEQDSELIEAVRVYKKKTDRALHRAAAALLLLLGAKLIIKKGRIAPTIANLKILQSIPNMYGELLSNNGYRTALVEVRKVLVKQPDFVSRVLRLSGDPAYIPAARESAIRDLAIDNTISVLSIEPSEALSRRVLVVGESALGSPVSAISDLVADTIPSLSGRLANDATTSISRFYRSMTKRAYDAVQADQSEALRFKYFGPSSGDPKIRPFCRNQMVQSESGTTWTRSDIDQMRNAEGTPVWTLCGGTNCRHQWIVALGGHDAQ